MKLKLALILLIFSWFLLAYVTEVQESELRGDSFLNQSQAQFTPIMQVKLGGCVWSYYMDFETQQVVKKEVKGGKLHVLGR